MAENRIDTTFAALKAEGKTAFIAYVSAGDPDMGRSLKIIHALDHAGVDIIELGLPFSDPLADGIVNQMAAQRALEAGATTAKTLDLIREFRKTSETPIVLYTYINPIYQFGFVEFHHVAAEAGIDGFLMLDLPPDEQMRNAELEELPEIKHIRLIAPTTPADRVPILAKAGEGFIYYVSRAGVTGAQASLAEGIAENVAAIKAHTEIPVAVGFGISTPEQAAEVARAADGIVVGSAIVRIIEENADDPKVAEKVGAFVKPLVEAAKNA